MLRTDRKTEPTRENAKEQKTQQTQKQNRKAGIDPAAALQALLAGQSPEQLPAESVLELSHSLGNSALLELMGARQTPPGEEARPLPAGPCATAPAEWSGGAPALTEAPAFAGMAPMGAAAPLAL